MTDEEIKRCLDIGILPNEMIGGQRVRRKLPELAIRLRVSEPLRIGASAEITMPIAEAGTSNERLLAVLATLRLFKKGRLSIPGILVFTQDWAIAGWTRWTYANPGWPPANEYQLETAEVENLK